MVLFGGKELGKLPIRFWRIIRPVEKRRWGGTVSKIRWTRRLCCRGGQGGESLPIVREPYFPIQFLPPTHCDPGDAPAGFGEAPRSCRPKCFALPSASSGRGSNTKRSRPRKVQPSIERYTAARVERRLTKSLSDP